MIVGRYYDFPRMRGSYYTSYSVESCQKQKCPGLNYWNPICQLGCHIETAAVGAGEAAYKGGVNAVNTGLQNVGEQLGKGAGAAAESISPTLIMLGIAALGVVAIAMVVR